MKKYCDLYYTIKKTNEGYVWFIRNKDGEALESSITTNEDGDQYYESRQECETDCQDAIEDHYR